MAERGETPKPIFVLVDLTKEEESDIITLLKEYKDSFVWLIDVTKKEESKFIMLSKEYKDCFGWSYEDMKGVLSKVVQHTISLRDDAKPVHQRPYDINLKYETIVKEEID